MRDLALERERWVRVRGKPRVQNERCGCCGALVGFAAFQVSLETDIGPCVIVLCGAYYCRDLVVRAFGVRS